MQPSRSSPLQQGNSRFRPPPPLRPNAGAHFSPFDSAFSPVTSEAMAPNNKLSSSRFSGSSKKYSCSQGATATATASSSRNPYDDEMVPNSEVDPNVFVKPHTHLVPSYSPSPTGGLGAFSNAQCQPRSPSFAGPQQQGGGSPTPYRPQSALYRPTGAGTPFAGQSPNTATATRKRSSVQGGNASPLQEAGRPPPQRFFSGCNVVVNDVDPVTKTTRASFRCGEMLGQGGFARVFDFVNVRTLERYACKIIVKQNLEPSKKEKLFLEIDIHRRLKHPNILNFIHNFEDDYYYYILLERCCRHSLMDLHMTRGIFTVPEIQHIMVQLLSATMYMHSNLVIHRDLKLGNIMLDPYGNVKVGDFGFACQLSSAYEKKKTMCGTPNYIAPEVLVIKGCKVEREGYTFSADIWSLGVILFTLGVGKPPFETEKVDTTYELIRRCEYHFPQGTYTRPSLPIPPLLKNMVAEMLQLRPDDRSSLVRLRQHPFLRGAPSTAPDKLVNLDSEISPISGSPIGQGERFSPSFSSSERCGSRSFPRLPPIGGSPRSPLQQQCFTPTCSLRQKTDPGQVHQSDPWQSSTKCEDTYNNNNNNNNNAPYPEEDEKKEEEETRTPSQPHAASSFALSNPSVTEYANYSKYGWCYRMVQEDGRIVFGITLNDRTKLVYDEESGQVWYFHRGRYGDCNADEKYYFHDMNEASAAAVGDQGASMALAKKLAILRFLRGQMPPQEDDSRGERTSSTRTQQENSPGETTSELPPTTVLVTAARYTTALRAQSGGAAPLVTDQPVFVKEFIPRSGAPLEEHPGRNLRLHTIRLSNGRFQQCLHVSMCPAADCVAIVGFGLCVAPWVLDYTSFTAAGTDFASITFASQSNQRCFTATTAMESIALVDESHVPNAALDIGTVRIPKWICSLIIRTIK